MMGQEAKNQVKCELCGNEVLSSTNLWPFHITMLDSFPSDGQSLPVNCIRMLCALCAAKAREQGHEMAVPPEERGRVLLFRSKSKVA